MSMPVSLLNGSQTNARLVNSDLLHRLDGLFAFYHRQWWCHRQMFLPFQTVPRFFEWIGFTRHGCGDSGWSRVGEQFRCGGIDGFWNCGERLERLQKVFIQSANVSIRLHDLRKDVDRIENLRARTTSRRI